MDIRKHPHFPDSLSFGLLQLSQNARNARRFPIALALIASACALPPADLTPSVVALSATPNEAATVTAAAQPTSTSPQPTVISPEPTSPPEATHMPQPTPAGPLDRWTDIRMTLQALSECTDETLFTVLPLASADNALMVPLGTLGPPGHTLPGNFILYFMRGHETGSTATTDVWAPGNVRTLTVESTIGRNDGQELSADYGVTFAPCRDRMFNLYHLSSLDSVLTSAIDATEPDFCNHEFQINEVTYQYCSYRIGLDLAAGARLGTAGGHMSNFSFEAYTLDAPQLEYVNPDRYKSDFEKALHVVCPLDYFVDELRLQQEALLGGFSNNKRTVEPVCGEVMLDLAGTAQGNWFTEGSGYANQFGSLALVRDNIDPHLAAFSVGGLVTEPGFWLFAPQVGGLVNRDFSAIRADGEIYCYEGLTATPASYAFTGHFLLQLIGESELLVEWQSGSCGAGSEFENPVSYER